MAITRRTETFRVAAEAVELALQHRGAEVHRDVIDLVLNQRIENVSREMGLTPRTAAHYLAFIDADDVAGEILRVLGTVGETPATPGSVVRPTSAPGPASTGTTAGGADVIDLWSRRRGRG